MERIVLADELVVLGAGSRLWEPARGLLDVALRLEQHDDTYTWYGWNKRQISDFLKNLPSLCSVVVGVWEAIPAEDGAEQHEELVLGVVCGVVEGEVRSIGTFDALIPAGLKPPKELEPGFDDGVEIMRAAREVMGPVAWALFIEKPAWDEWLFASRDDGAVVDKGELLVSFARQGRCVFMGSQTRHRHH